MNKFIRTRPINHQILSELLESEISDDEINRLFNFDLKNEQYIRKVLKGSAYAQYHRIKEECEHRKALQVILYAMIFKKRLNALLIKSISYPLFLFCLSFFMMLFVKLFLFPTFQTLLLFLGPLSNLKHFEYVLNVLILLDMTVILLCYVICWFVKYRSVVFYAFLSTHFKHHIWQKLISREFCEKFIYFYQLGGSLELIVQQIQWSSHQVLCSLCKQILVDLESGHDLSQTFGAVDSNLEIYFKMNMEGIDIIKYLKNHNHIQEIMLTYQIKKYSRFILLYAYLVIMLLIVIIYQVMLMPIQMMGDLL